MHYNPIAQRIDRISQNYLNTDKNVYLKYFTTTVLSTKEIFFKYVYENLFESCVLYFLYK